MLTKKRYRAVTGKKEGKVEHIDAKKLYYRWLSRKETNIGRDNKIYLKGLCEMPKLFSLKIQRKKHVHITIEQPIQEGIQY